jgi:hypothetical protein
MVRADLMASLIHSIGEDAVVRWQPGACAVLEEVDGDAVVRRMAFRPEGDSWLLGTEQLLVDGEVRISAAFDDYRPVDASVWAWRSEITDPVRGSLIVLSTRKLRTEGITDAFFAMSDQ